MKKTIRLFAVAVLAFAMIFAFAACDSSESTTTAAPKTTGAAATATPAPATDAPTEEPTPDVTPEPTPDPDATPVPVPSADILNMSFESGAAVNNVENGYQVGTFGEPTVADDATLNKKVGVTDETSSFYIVLDDDFYTTVASSITLEAYVRVDADQEYPINSYVDIFSGMQSGGCGIEYHRTAGFQFYVHNGSYSQVDYNPDDIDSLFDTWVHFAATYDGEDMCFYINGELVGETEAPGVITAVADEPAKLFCVGSDVDREGKIESASIASFAFARIYSQVLNADQIATLYAQR